MNIIDVKVTFAEVLNLASIIYADVYANAADVPIIKEAIKEAPALPASNQIRPIRTAR